jgi:hypothetical protein
VTAKGGTGDPTRTLLEPTSLMGALIAPFKCVVSRDGDGEAAGTIGCDFLGLRFDGEEFFCCDGLRRAGELACRGGILIFCCRSDSWPRARFLFPAVSSRKKRSVDTVSGYSHIQSRTSVRTPAVRNPQFSVVGPCDRSVGRLGRPLLVPSV